MLKLFLFTRTEEGVINYYKLNKCRIISFTNFNAQFSLFINNMFVTLLSSCSKHVEDNSVTNILLMNKENCVLKLVDEIILYYDARSKKRSTT